MKKLMIGVLAIVAVAFSTSCSKDCVTCDFGGGNTEYCESDYDDQGTGITWAQWKDAAIASGYCD